MDGADAAGAQGGQVLLEIPAQRLSGHAGCIALRNVVVDRIINTGSRPVILCLRGSLHRALRRLLLHQASAGVACCASECAGVVDRLGLALSAERRLVRLAVLVWEARQLLLAGARRRN